MPEVRQRTNFGGVARQPANTQAAPKVDDLSWTQSGAAARQQAAQEAEAALARRSQVFQPQRFHIKAGEQADVIILDYSIERVPNTELTLQTQGIPSYFEHDLSFEPAFARNNKFGNKMNILEPCPKVQEACPICRFLGKESTFVMLLTILDTRSITSKAGVTTPFRRQIMCVKNEQHAAFHRLFDKVGGKPRGMHLLMTRDGAREAGIGKPEYQTVLTEDQLLQYFSHPAELHPDGKVKMEANAMLQPFLYGTFLKRPSSEDIHKKYAFLPVTAGSATANERGWGDRPSQGTAAQQPSGGFQQRAAGGFQGAAVAQHPVQAEAANAGGFAGRAAPAQTTQVAQDDLDEDEIPF